MSIWNRGFFEKNKGIVLRSFLKNRGLMLQKWEKQQYHVSVFGKKPKVFRNKQK